MVMKKFPGLLIILFLLFILAVTSVEDEKNTLDRPEPSAPISETVKGACTTVWLTYPSYYNEIKTGAKKCLTLKRTGWLIAYRSDGSVLDYVSPYGVTKVAPHSGDGSATAKRIKDFAAKYHVTLQFSKVDGAGRVGCSVDGFRNSVSGSYYGSPYKPGAGLIRLGTGKYRSCISKYPAKNMDIAKHEIAHAVMERKCKGDSIFREENTTDAYAYRYFGASRSAGNYGFSDKDYQRAGEVYRGVC